MKVTVSLTFDLSDTFYNVDDTDCIKESLFNLGQFLQDLHLSHLSERTSILRDTSFSSLEERESSLRYNADKLKLSGQLFNNYRVEGQTEDGYLFKFTHVDPGYKEELVIGNSPQN